MRLATALLCALAVGGCSSSAPTEPGPFQGSYASTNGGPIASLSFPDADHYVLQRAMPCGGLARSVCVENGTFAFDDAHGALALTSEETGQTTVVYIDSLRDASGASSQSVHVANTLVDPRALLNRCACAAPGHASDCPASQGCTLLTPTSSTFADPNQLLDVNDVSILFARTASGALPDMSLDESVGGTLGNLLSASAFNNVYANAQGLKAPSVLVSGPAVTAGTDRSTWRIYGVRFDPCSDDLDPKTAVAQTCAVQIRLIAEQVLPNARGANDLAMHLVYTLGSNQDLSTRPYAGGSVTVLNAIRSDLLGIKQASIKAGAPTAGQPLGVHPGLLSGGKTQVATLVRQFIDKWLQTVSSHDFKVTFTGFTRDADTGPWTLFRRTRQREATPSRRSPFRICRTDPSTGGGARPACGHHRVGQRGPEIDADQHRFLPRDQRRSHAGGLPD